MQVKLLSGILFFFISFFLPYLLQAQADLATIQVVANNVNANRNLTYTILVVNNGPGSVAEVILEDILPIGTTFVSFSAPPGWNVILPPIGTNDEVIATIPTLPSGAMQTFNLVVNVGSLPSGTQLTNIATFFSSTPDPLPNNNQSGGISFVAGGTTASDIGVFTSLFLQPVYVGGNIIYLIQVANVGTSAMSGVSFADVIPSGATFVSFSALSGWAVVRPEVGSNGIVTASLPLLFPGATSVFVLVTKLPVNLPAGILLINNAAVTSNTPDLNQNNNYSLNGSRPLSLSPADLAITKTGPATVSAGSSITYTITVRNNGPNNAENVSLFDVLQLGSTFLSLVSPPGWAVGAPPVGNSGTITATIPLLASGATATFILAARTADNLTGTTLNNSVSVSSGNVDPVATNNSSVSTATIIGGTSCIITCPSNIVTTNAPGQCGAVVNFPLPVISGNCGTMTATPASGSFFPIGTTTVRINTSTGATCSFNIRVNETQPPVITSCPALESLCSNSTGMYTIPRLVATDNCGPAIIDYTISGATSRTGNSDNASGQFNTGTSTITWTVRDSSNNVASCQTMVTVNSPVAATIGDATALGTGVNINTVYQGYAPASKITLTAKASGGTPPYSYAWSNGATTASIEVSPAIATAYRVTITDSAGCSQVSTEKLVQVVHVTCGSKGEKVQVCIVPPGNFGVSYNGCVEAGAVAALLKAGSRLGSCGVTEDYTLSLKAIPNPTYSYFTLDVTSTNTNDRITLNIYTVTGRLIESRTVSANSKVPIGASYHNGTYLAEAVQGTKKATLLLVKLG